MARVVGPLWAGTRRGLVAAADLVLPSRCAACHGAGGPLCVTCTDAVRLSSRAVEVGGAGPLIRPPGMPSCWAGARFEGAVRLAVTAYKDEGRRDLRATLARPLSAALAGAAAGDPVLRRRLALGENTFYFLVKVAPFSLPPKIV
jgi:predicted amidophosphoribosyltransferase